MPGIMTGTALIGVITGMVLTIILTKGAVEAIIMVPGSTGPMVKVAQESVYVGN